MAQSGFSTSAAKISGTLLIGGALLVLVGAYVGFVSHGNPVAVYVLFGGGVAMFAGGLAVQWRLPAPPDSPAAVAAAVAAAAAPVAPVAPVDAAHP
jgi:hypothetical protein